MLVLLLLPLMLPAILLLLLILLLRILLLSPSSVFKHIPPFRQGCISQGSSFSAQIFPFHPIGHLQIKSMLLASFGSTIFFVFFMIFFFILFIISIMSLFFS